MLAIGTYPNRRTQLRHVAKLICTIPGFLVLVLCLPFFFIAFVAWMMALVLAICPFGFLLLISLIGAILASGVLILAGFLVPRYGISGKAPFRWVDSRIDIWSNRFDVVIDKIFDDGLERIITVFSWLARHLLLQGEK